MDSAARNSIFSAIIFSFCLLFLLVGLEGAGVPPGGLSKYLPQSGEAGEWMRNDIPQEYKGEDLYLYIDGGAEIYHEYGFKEVTVQDYKNASGRSISLEIFEMMNDAAAYGIYTFKRSAEGETLALGNEGQIEDYYLNFWKGNFLVTLTGFDEEKETVEGLVELAKAVDAKIESEGKTPTLVSLLYAEGLVEPSIKYFKGNLGLYNIYRFFTKDVFRIQEGVKGSYKRDYEVFIFKYKDIEESQERLNEAKERFRQGPGYKNFRVVEDVLEFIDSHSKRIFVKSFREYILLLLGAGNEYAAGKILSNIQDNISSK